MQVSGYSRSFLLGIILDLRLREYAKKKLTDFECETFLIPLIEDENIERTLQLARLFQCTPVIQHILRKLRRRKELLHYYLEDGKLQDAVELCVNEKKNDLWIDLLVYISKLDGPINDELIQNMLQEIGVDETLHPLLVLDILSRSNTLRVGSIKEYVVKWLYLQERQMESSKEAICENVLVIEEIDRQIESIKFNFFLLGSVNDPYSHNVWAQQLSHSFVPRFHVMVIDASLSQSDRVVRRRCSEKGNTVLQKFVLILEENGYYTR
ncbi:hypothetical protein DICVIV_12837 [Dictyocaulus viviparus]|uniref:Uncharacterized protein n=1 Tax=Dictyocaulus viviparus TaxID=29172 RepID=A0A0D8XC24_DICVI|nr:hypothetical protein DICVIV_12837 [Dictyocaulus viviparus]